MQINSPAEYDEVMGGYLISSDTDTDWYILPMIVNHRLVSVSRMEADSFGPPMKHGWCFSNVNVAVLACRVFDPLTQDEPVGWHKRAAYGPTRRAPRRDEEPEYNLPRCEHGTYLHASHCDHHMFCDGFRARRQEARGESTTGLAADQHH